MHKIILTPYTGMKLGKSFASHIKNVVSSLSHTKSPLILCRVVILNGYNTNLACSESRSGPSVKLLLSSSITSY